MVVISEHAKKQIGKRGITEEEVADIVEHGEVTHEERDDRFGTKKHCRLDCGGAYLVVIWFYNRKGEKEVATVFWRRKKRPSFTA